jgi:hypothetical protein
LTSTAAVTPAGVLYVFGQNKVASSPANSNFNWTTPAVVNSDIWDNYALIRTSIYGGSVGQEKLVIAGDYGKIAYFDGSTWTAANGNNAIAGFEEREDWEDEEDDVDNNSYISSIAYGGGKFVAVGQGGKISYSSSGDITSATWTAVPDASNPFRETYDSEDNDLYYTSVKVTYGGGKFVAVTASRGSDDPMAKIAVSSDGSTWTTATNPPAETISKYNFVGYGNGMFIVSGDVYGGAYLWYSEDGSTWTRATAVESNGQPGDHLAESVLYTPTAITFVDGTCVPAGDPAPSPVSFKRFITVGKAGSVRIADVE